MYEQKPCGGNEQSMSPSHGERLGEQYSDPRPRERRDDANFFVVAGAGMMMGSITNSMIDSITNSESTIPATVFTVGVVLLSIGLVELRSLTLNQE